MSGFGVLRFYQGSASVRYGAVYLCALGAFPGGPGFLSWGLNNSAGPAVRAVSGGWIVTLGTLGGILATWSYLKTDGPDYPIGHTINLVAQVVVLCLASFGIGYCVWENRLRARGGRDYRLQGKTEEGIRDLGYRYASQAIFKERLLTIALRHPEFRYIT